MTHLTEDTLLQYAFDLLERDTARSALQHLDECPECRRQLAALQNKFSAMDVLEGQVEPSETLIKKTLATKSAPAKILPFYRNPSFGWAAAAVAVIGVWLLYTPSQKTAQPISGGSSVRFVDADRIPDVPPFAPASAIELVVLPSPDKMQLTIYNSADLTLVRDTRKLTLKPGWNWLQFMWAETLIDPTSLSLRPLEYVDKIDIQQLVYPARLKDIGRWLIRSEVEGAVPFEITYFASGLSWRAFYMGTMNEDETLMDLKGYVNVANYSGQDFTNAHTRLIVGQTRLTEDIRTLAQRRYPYGPEIIEEDGYVTKYNWLGKDEKIPILGEKPILGRLFFNRLGVIGGDLAYDIKQIEKTGLSEYFLYTIEGTEDLPNTWAKRLQSLDVGKIPVKSLYKYDEDRYGNETVRFLSFKNDAEHELGETPIPEGNVRLYRRLNEQMNLSYIGSTDVKYIPVNEDVELNLGASPLVKIEPKLMDSKTDNYTFNPKGDIDGWDEIETWEIKLTNTREIPVEMEITRNFGMDYWKLKLNDSVGTAHPTYTKHDKNHARFTVILPPRFETTLGFTVTKYQQRRSEYYVQKMIQEIKEPKQ
jgi:hypothetical protein